jgi:Na+-driven multidrug efflux pump
VIVLLRAAVPLFVAMVTGTVGSLVVTSVLGRHDTVTLAAFGDAVVVVRRRAGGQGDRAHRAQAVERSSLWYFAVCYGVLLAAAVPVARTWGITGLWVAMAAANGLLVVLQSLGFHRHSARIGQQPGSDVEPRQVRKV